MKSEAERESELRSRPIPSLQVDIVQLASGMVHNPDIQERFSSLEEIMLRLKVLAVKFDMLSRENAVYIEELRQLKPDPSTLHVSKWSYK